MVDDSDLEPGGSDTSHVWSSPPEPPSPPSESTPARPPHSSFTGGTTTWTGQPTPTSARWPTPSRAPVMAAPSAPSDSRRGEWWRLGVVAIVAALVGGLSGHFWSNASSVKPTYDITTSNDKPGSPILEAGLTITQIVNRVTPAVVSIDVRTSQEEDQGTGMILTSNGLIVTNNHVIAAINQGYGGTITVTRTGQTRAIPAVLIGTDPSQDVALIQAQGVSGLPHVTLGDSNDLATGDSVVAIGNALGLSAGTPTVTNGIVSALGRTVTASGEAGNETLHNMIQTDAAINPGNSGGPLLDSNGNVIGMNTAVAGTLPDGENAQNIGFAIPVQEIRTLLPLLKNGGTVEPTGGGPELGVEIVTLTPAIAESYGLSQTSGALVVEVKPDSAASAAGIEVGDTITAIDGTRITTADQVTTVIKHDKVGQRITISIVRNSQHLTLKATLGSTAS